ncbi:MAG TPA: zinc ribbon domain-containing protein, partial [Thermomicrobiales bacterium]|nr:zinc ribbon domain-containing protein [Thermomicrobiales bacterium]
MVNASDSTPTPSSQPAHECPACGKPVDPEWRFCSHCGATVRLEDFSPDATRTPQPDSGNTEYI